MDASKENCLKASECLETITPNELRESDSAKFLREFLKVATKKLPSQAAFDRERTKRLIKGGVVQHSDIAH